jgi:hypothetical protein
MEISMRLKDFLLEADVNHGTPTQILIQYMKKHGYKSLQINGGSYGYSSSLTELTKPKIKWYATDGSPITTKTVAEISGWLDSNEDWDSFWEQERVEEADLEDLTDNFEYIKFSKKPAGEYGNQEDWETDKIKGSR